MPSTPGLLAGGGSRYRRDRASRYMHGECRYVADVGMLDAWRLGRLRLRVYHAGMTPTPVHVTRAGYITQDGSTLGIVAKVGRTWHYQPKQDDGLFGPASMPFRTQSGAVTHLLAIRRIATDTYNKEMET